MHDLIWDIYQVLERSESVNTPAMIEVVGMAIREYYNNAKNIVRIPRLPKPAEEYSSTTETSDTLEPSPETDIRWTIATI